MDLNVTIRDHEMKKLFLFSHLPNSSDFCNNETIALYYDKHLTRLYEQPEFNPPIELINSVVNKTYTSQKIVIHTT